MTDLRPCSICQSYSQANLCHYTYKNNKNYKKFTFVHLRYSLGGGRPSQTTRHAMSSLKLTLIKLTGWYFTKRLLNIPLKKGA